MSSINRCAQVFAIALSLWIGAAMAADRENWLVLERTGSGRPETINVVRDLPAAPTRAKFPVLLEVAWRYKSLPNGMPAAEESALGKRLFESLDEIIGANGVHVMTITGDGTRTMSYQVENAERHARALKAFFDALPPVSVNVRARDEPDWETVREVLKAIK